MFLHRKSLYIVNEEQQKKRYLTHYLTEDNTPNFTSRLRCVTEIYNRNLSASLLPAYATKLLTSVYVLASDTGLICNRGKLTVEPPDILLLLLIVNVVWDEKSEASVDTTLLEVLLKKDLEVFVQVVERRALLEVRAEALGES